MHQPLGLTSASFAALGPHQAVTSARWAAELGFTSFWVAETTGPEAFATLAAAGAASETVGAASETVGAASETVGAASEPAGAASESGGLALGTGVLALQLRDPALTAMGAATLAALHPERDVLVGIGVSSPVVTTRWHGVPYGTRPLGRVREFVEVLGACLAGDAVSYDGEHYHLDRFRLGVRLGERRPKVILGALNTRMLSLAGEVADGVLLNYLPASAVPWCVEQVRAGERVAGRAEGSCTVYAYVHVGVCERPDGIDAARRDLFSYIVVDAYADAFRRAGFEAEVEAVRTAHAARDRDGALAAVSDTMVDAIDIMGDADHVRASVAAYRNAGVDHPVVMPLPWGPDRMGVVRATMEAVAS